MVATESSSRDRTPDPWWVGLLAVLAFLPSLRNGFVYDDETYVLKNALITSWSADHLWAILTRPYFGNFHPLHILALAVERSIFGLSPVGWHAVSILLHGLNAALLCRLLPRLGVSRGVALVGAALFAIHPVQVESVAWVSEQKNLLSLLFTLLSFGGYLDARATGSRAKLAASVLWFLASLAAKVEAVALVPVLAAVEVLKPPGPGPGRGRALPRLIPFVLLAGAWANFEIIAHGRSGFIHPYPGGSLGAALLSLGPVLALYAKNLLWPMGLSAAYDLPPATQMSPVALIVLWILVLVCLAWLFRRARREPERRIALGIVWVGAALAPVLNLIPIGTLLNDRYLYVPLCAIGPMAAAGLGALSARWLGSEARQGARLVARVACGALVCALAAGSAIRSGVWRDEERLWRDAASKCPRSGHARYNLGTLWLERGEPARAEPELRAALEADPAMADAYHNLGTLHFRQARFRLAAVEFGATAKLMPKDYRAWMDLGSALAQARRDDEAISALERAVALAPRVGRPHLGLALLFERRGDRVRAAGAFRAFLTSGEGKEGQRRLAREHLRNIEAQIRNPKGSG